MKKNLISNIINVILSIILIALIVDVSYKKPEIIYLDKIIVIYEDNLFDKDKFAKTIKNTKIKFPHIVYAQSILETGNWNSTIFIENNNLFGMRNSFSRATTANGSSMGYACYNTWKDSLYDYALYQSSYTRHIKTEDDYFNHLKSSYASDPLYVNKLKYLIKTNKLKELFKNLKS
jgi:flagellum-specific peptidoglycan hydrolase FlgJ